MKSSRRSKTTASLKAHAGFDRDLMRRLAWFRYQLRQFLRFSEKAARAAGVTPQQHQLLLGVAGYTGRGWATIGELAEFLQERHNAVVGLVERAARRGLVRKVQGTPDRRFIRVHLTPRGEAVLARLAERHHEEVSHLASRMLPPSRVRSGALWPVKGA
jgi:DNA-binding MarR family transcriptional regulator